jgi:uncharacterized protein YjiS (DUF1127 family)
MATQQLKTNHAAYAGSTTPIGERGRSLLRYLRDTIRAWRDSARSRFGLRQLPDHMLKDIGLSRSDAHWEACKPFWRE